MIFVMKNILYICNKSLTTYVILQHYIITYSIVLSFFCNIFVIKNNPNITTCQEVV